MTNKEERYIEDIEHRINSLENMVIIHTITIMIMIAVFGSLAAR